MRVHVKLFSHLRRLVPFGARGRIDVDLADGATLGFLLTYLGLAGQVDHITVNDEPEADRGRVLRERDRVCLFPSGAEVPDH